MRGRTHLRRPLSCPPPSLSHISHTSLSTTHLCPQPSLSHPDWSRGDAAALCVAGVALGDIHVPCARQACHLEPFTRDLRCRRWVWWRAQRRHTPSFIYNFIALCVAGVALGDIHFCVAGMALGDIHLRFAWQAWHLGHWAGSGGALGLHWSPVTPRNFAWQAWHLATSTLVLRGRRGPWSHPPSFCVAGAAPGDIYLGFAWQAWHLATSAFVLRARRVT